MPGMGCFGKKYLSLHRLSSMDIQVHTGVNNYKLTVKS